MWIVLPHYAVPSSPLLATSSGVPGTGRALAEGVEVRLELRQDRFQVRARLQPGPAAVVEEPEVILDGSLKDVKRREKT